MQNRPRNLFADRRQAGRPSTGEPPLTQPGHRLVWLFVAMLVPLLAVTVRLVQLQCWLVDDYVAALQATTESLEPIPSIDGRISTADGQVLAEDIERFHISVHYRWLEDPPNPRWISRQAIADLSRQERRNRTLVEREKEKVRERQNALWKRLAELSGTSPESLAQRRAAVQRRVERIAAIVAGRQESAAVARNPVIAADFSSLERVWSTISTALTTPPERGEREPVIVREELEYHRVIDDVPLEVRAEIEAHPRRYPGVRVGRTSRRVYHNSGFAPHVVGARVPATEEDLAPRMSKEGRNDPLDYRSGDRIGRSGVEASYDAHLRGLRGVRRVVRNRYGEIVAETTVREPRRGGDVEVTLNSVVQRRMEEVLDRSLAPAKSAGKEAVSVEKDVPTPTGGCVVALDAQSGAVLVAASAPRFDLGQTGVPDAALWKRLSEEPRHPLMDRVTQMAIPPGSVFKVVSAAAMLESRRVDPDQRFDCRGYLDRPDRFRCLIFSQHGIGHGPVDLGGALSRSCNVYFFHAADVMGPEPLVAWASRFGIGRATGIDLPFERSGRLPSPDDESSGRERTGAWHAADTRALAIGQSTLTTTPLQIARLMAAVANGGYLVQPFVARKSGPQLADGESSTPSRRQPIPGLSEESLRRIRTALERTVNDPEGTAYKSVRLDSVTIAGKTGTAQVAAGQPDHAWFAGYAPAEKPRIAFAVVLEHAGAGGKAAGPIARQLVEAFLKESVLEPTHVTARD